MDILRIAALLLVSAGFGAGALFLASRFGLHRLWLSPRPAPIDPIIDRLAELADDARARGLIAVAAPAASLHLPLLSRGINLLIDGSQTHAVRQQLEQELDHSIDASRRAFGSRSLAFIAIAGLVIALASSIAIAAFGEISLPLMLGSTLFFPAGIALAIHCAGRLHEAAAAPQRMLLACLAIEAVCLISARRDGRMVRAHLRSLLPATASVPAAAAA